MNLMSPHYHQTRYDKSACTLGVVHIGYGAFHRAHQAVYFDDYMEATGDLSWGIAAVNLRPTDAETFKRSAQIKDGYLLKTTAPDSQKSYRCIRPHLVYKDWSSDKQAAEGLLGLKSVHLVTVTVTESGYYLNGSGMLNLADPLIEAEIAGGSERSVYAYLAAALAHRMKTTGLPVSILCCDNIRANGLMLERSLLAYLAAREQAELADWIRKNVTFPCSMVDRITPRASDSLKDEVGALFSDQNLDPIHGESFTQWVLEDKFAAPVPALDKAGVEIVANVHPYEEAKIRILNGGHTGLCYLGALAGLKTFDETMHDADCRAHFDDLEDHNILPGISFDLPFDKRAYRQMVAERFSNRAIADSLERICMDGYAKFPVFIVPTLADCLAQNLSPTFAYDAVASWYVYARRFAAGQTNVHYIEPNWSALEPLLADGQADSFARARPLWGDLPEKHEEFVPELLTAIKRMERKWQN